MAQPIPLEAPVKSLALEVGRRAITVNAVAPGYIQTPMTQSLSPRQQERYLQRTGAARPGTPQDVAGPVAFLLSDTIRPQRALTIPGNSRLIAS